MHMHLVCVNRLFTRLPSLGIHVKRAFGISSSNKFICIDAHSVHSLLDIHTLTQTTACLSPFLALTVHVSLCPSL